MNQDVYQFRQEIPVATRLEVERLRRDGYVIHKEWGNGIELRKGKPFRGWLLLLHVLFPAFLFPGFMRSLVDNFFGYQYRLFVTLDENAPSVLMA